MARDLWSGLARLRHPAIPSAADVGEVSSPSTRTVRLYGGESDERASHRYSALAAAGRLRLSPAWKLGRKTGGRAGFGGEADRGRFHTWRGGYALRGCAQRRQAMAKLNSRGDQLRILIYRLGSLGDTVVALPCFHLIARRFPQADRRTLTNLPVAARAPAMSEVLRHSGLAHGWLAYPLASRTPRQWFPLLRAIRQWQP